MAASEPEGVVSYLSVTALSAKTTALKARPARQDIASQGGAGGGNECSRNTAQGGREKGKVRTRTCGTVGPWKKTGGGHLSELDTSASGSSQAQAGEGGGGPTSRVASTREVQCRPDHDYVKGR